MYSSHARRTRASSRVIVPYSSHTPDSSHTPAIPRIHRPKTRVPCGRQHPLVDSPASSTAGGCIPLPLHAQARLLLARGWGGVDHRYAEGAAGSGGRCAQVVDVLLGHCFERQPGRCVTFERVVSTELEERHLDCRRPGVRQVPWGCQAWVHGTAGTDRRVGRERETGCRGVGGPRKGEAQRKGGRRGARGG
jgi:hypothetical protein